MTDTNIASVIAALSAGSDDRKSTSALCAMTGLSRPHVEQVLAVLAAERRLARSLADQDGVLV